MSAVEQQRVTLALAGLNATFGTDQLAHLALAKLTGDPRVMLT